MAVFALVHGGMAGSWCWDLLVPELHARGHETMTVDLPSSDPAAGCMEYARTCEAAFADAPDDVIVVGHSMAGLTIPVLATLQPVGRLVYLTALIPRPGMSALEHGASEPQMWLPDALGSRTVSAEGTHTRTPEQSIAAFFHDAPDEVARWAVERLRPQSQTPLTETTPLQAMPDVPVTYILATDDRCLSADWLRAKVPTYLGVRPVEMPGSHSPYMTRPAELAEVLDEIA